MSTRPPIDDYYLAMLPLVASRGTCPRRQVACVLTDDKGRLVATGYNGTAPNTPHCIDAPCPGAAGAREACEAIHAECSALLQARASRREPHTAYCSLTPCFYCAKMLVSAGVRRVVAAEWYKYDDAGPAYLIKNGVVLKIKETV